MTSVIDATRYTICLNNLHGKWEHFRMLDTVLIQISRELSCYNPGVWKIFYLISHDMIEDNLAILVKMWYEGFINEMLLNILCSYINNTILSRLWNKYFEN